MKNDYYQRLDRFRKETIIAWVQARGFSFFAEELEGVEKREEPARLAAIARQVEAEWVAKVAAECSRHRKGCGDTIRDRGGYT